MSFCSQMTFFRFLFNPSIPIKLYLPPQAQKPTKISPLHPNPIVPSKSRTFLPQKYFCRSFSTIPDSSQKIIDIYEMEDSSKPSLSQKFGATLTHLKLKSQKLDQVSAHCREDHLAISNLDERKNKSCYRSNYSPPKQFPDYNQAIAERELQKFRKHQSSALLLPTILNNSQYQTAFKQRNQEGVTRSKQKQSWFMKAEWAVNTSSESKAKYNDKSGKQFNKTNHLRSDYNTLSTFKLNQAQKSTSSYDKDYKAYLLKKEGKLSIGDRDHLASKENQHIQTGLTEYQRKYDSIVEASQSRLMTLSYYPRDAIIKRNKI